MAKFVPLFLIGIETFWPEKLRSEAEELNDRIQKALDTRARIEADEQRLRALKPAEMTAKEVSGLKGIPMREFVALQVEVAIFTAMEPFAAKAYAVLKEERDIAYADLEAKKADVRKRLVSIGYVDAEPTLGIQGTIMPGWIFVHPDVRAAKRRFEQLDGRTGGNPPTYMEQLAGTEERLRALRDAA